MEKKIKLIKQSHKIIKLPKNALKKIEKIARVCYKSESKITEDSAGIFVANLIKRKHFAMLEFLDIRVKFITNRGVTHELVRHRMASYAQESTRYVSYKKNIEFIKPVWFELYSEKCKKEFVDYLHATKKSYQNLISNGWSPQLAREVLPNALKTEITVKANIREWRHIFNLRCEQSAHPQIRNLMIGLLNELKCKMPIFFDDIDC